LALEDEEKGMIAAPVDSLDKLTAPGVIEQPL
jgi:hypothetical protein